MPPHRYLIAFVLHVALFALIDPASPRAADEKGSIVSATDVYSGPGRYPIVGRVKRGQQVQIAGCDSGHNWCEIVADKVRGWISGNAFEVGKKDRRSSGDK